MTLTEKFVVRDPADLAQLMAGSDWARDHGDEARADELSALATAVAGDPVLGKMLGKLRTPLQMLRDSRFDTDHRTRLAATVLAHNWATNGRVAVALALHGKAVENARRWARKNDGATARPLPVNDLLSQKTVTDTRPARIVGAGKLPDSETHFVLFAAAPSEIRIDARYVGLLWRLFPEADWSGTDEKSPIVLRQEGLIVGLAMPLVSR